MVAHREVRAPDAALEQHVADDSEAARLVEEDHVAGRVPGAMDHLKRQFAHGHRVPVLQPAIRLEHLAADAVFAPVVVQPADPEAIGLVRPFDGQAQVLRQHSRLAAVIDMAMGDEDLFQLHARLRDIGLQHVEIAARIDQRRLVRGGAPDQRTILLQRRDRQDGGFQGRCRGGLVHARRCGCARHAMQAAGAGLDQSTSKSTIRPSLRKSHSKRELR